jgi:hypothetical protein
MQYDANQFFLQNLDFFENQHIYREMMKYLPLMRAPKPDKLKEVVPKIIPDYKQKLEDFGRPIEPLNFVNISVRTEHTGFGRKIDNWYIKM